MNDQNPRKSATESEATNDEPSQNPQNQTAMNIPARPRISYWFINRAARRLVNRKDTSLLGNPDYKMVMSANIPVTEENHSSRIETSVSHVRRLPNLVVSRSTEVPLAVPPSGKVADNSPQISESPMVLRPRCRLANAPLPYQRIVKRSSAQMSSSTTRRPILIMYPSVNNRVTTIRTPSTNTPPPLPPVTITPQVNPPMNFSIPLPPRVVMFPKRTNHVTNFAQSTAQTTVNPGHTQTLVDPEPEPVQSIEDPEPVEQFFDTYEDLFAIPEIGDLPPEQLLADPPQVTREVTPDIEMPLHDSEETVEAESNKKSELQDLLSVD